MKWYLFLVTGIIGCSFTNLAFANMQSQGREVVLNSMVDLQTKKYSQNDVLLVNPDIGDEKSKVSSEAGTRRELTKFLAGKQLVGIKHVPDEGYYYKFVSDKGSRAATSAGQGSVHGSYINSKLMRLMEEGRQPR